MSDYAKLKNADLEAMLKERGLPHAGKKADMVARLQEDDKKKASETAKSTTAVPDEDVIDYDDEETGDAPAASSKAGAATIAAGGKGQVDNPQAVPNQATDIEPSKTDDLAVKPPNDADDSSKDATKETTTESKPPVDFTRGLAATDIESEIEKRKKRAEKFGVKIDDDKDAQEALQKLERMKKFGEAGGPKGLDEALPTERPKKRGREGGDQGGRGRSKRRGGVQQAGQRRGPRDQGASGNGTWMTASDREAAAKRKARFA